MQGAGDGGGGKSRARGERWMQRATRSPGGSGPPQAEPRPGQVAMQGQGQGGAGWAARRLGPAVAMAGWEAVRRPAAPPAWRAMGATVLDRTWDTGVRIEPELLTFFRYPGFRFDMSAARQVLFRLILFAAQSQRGIANHASIVDESMLARRVCCCRGERSGWGLRSELVDGCALVGA